MQNNLKNSYLTQHKELILILGLAIISAYYFVLNGFPSDDYLLYALGINNIKQNGITEIPKSFNGEMSFGYYLMVYGLLALFKEHVELSKLLNYAGAIISIIMVYYVYKLFNELIKNNKITLFICLNVILSPTIWLHSHFGHPITFAVTFYLGSLFYFNRLAKVQYEFKKGKYDYILFMFFALLAVMYRFDIILGIGAYLGIIYFNKIKITSIINKLLLTFGLLLLIFIALKYYFLGYITNIQESRLAYHITARLDYRYIAKNMLKNIIFWVVGINVVTSFLSLCGIIRFGLKSKIVVMLLLWITPFCIFLPFGGVEVSRLTAPTVPIIVAVAIMYVYDIFKKKAVTALSIALILSQIFPIILYYSIEKYYPLKVKIEQRYIAKIPIGFLFADHYYRQKLISAKTEIARQVASEKNGNILIIDFTADGLYYVYYILQTRKLLSSNFLLEKGSYDCRQYNDLDIGEFETDTNKFYILSIDHNWQHKSPITDTLQKLNISNNKVHIGYFIDEFHINTENIFLNATDLKRLLDSESNIMSVRRKLISK